MRCESLWAETVEATKGLEVRKGMTKLHSILGSVVIVQACIKSALDQALNIDYLPQMTVKPLVFLLEVLYPELTELVDG